MEEKLVKKKKKKLCLFAGANKLGGHSINLSLLSYFFMSKTCKEWRMGKRKFMATVSLQQLLKEVKFSFTLSALQYLDHKFTRAWK